MNRIFVLILVICLGLAGCQFDPYSLSYTQVEPHLPDLVGQYHTNAATKKLILEEGKYPSAEATISLHGDGTFTMTNIPDWWWKGKTFGSLNSEKGTWKIIRHQKWWAIFIRIDSSSDFPRGFNTDWSLVGNKPPYKIHLTIGDPDSGDAMQFERDS